MDVSYKNNILVINGISCELPEMIAELIAVDDLIPVRLDNYRLIGKDDHSLNRNIMAYSAQGRLIWTVQEAPHGGLRAKPYIKIFIQDNQLLAINWIGVAYCIEPSSGWVKADKSAGRPW